MIGEEDERADVSQGKDGEPCGAVADACVGGTFLEVLLSTGDTTNLIQKKLGRELEDKPDIRPYEEH